MPGDLNLKKSWNPALVKNQTKVWKQEQKTLEEFKKIKEREQEYAQEQETLKLLTLKNKSNATLTKSDKLKMNKLDWMYDDVVADNTVKELNVPKSTVIQNNLDKPKNSLDALDPMSAIKKSMIKEDRKRSREHSPTRDNDENSKDRHGRHRDTHRHRSRHKSGDREHKSHRESSHRESSHRSRSYRHRESSDKSHRERTSEDKPKPIIPY